MKATIISSTKVAATIERTGTITGVKLYTEKGYLVLSISEINEIYNLIKK